MLCGMSFCVCLPKICLLDEMRLYMACGEGWANFLTVKELIQNKVIIKNSQSSIKNLKDTVNCGTTKKKQYHPPEELKQ